MKTLIGILICLTMFLNGCASLMIYNGSKEQILVRKVAEQDDMAIKSIRLNDNMVGIGIDITKWEALKERPLLQLTAAVIDACAIYFGGREINKIKENIREHHNNITINNSNVNVYNQTGD